MSDVAEPTEAFDVDDAAATSEDASPPAEPAPIEMTEAALEALLFVA